MNIQKSRLAAIIGLMLLVCMIATTMIIPASAAEYEIITTVVQAMNQQNGLKFLEITGADLYDYESREALAAKISYGNVIHFFYDIENQRVFITEHYADFFCMRYEAATGHSIKERLTYNRYYNGHTKYVAIENANVPESVSGANRRICYNDDDIVDAVSMDNLSGVLNEILCLLSIVIPVLIGFIGLDKAIKFITGVLHSA